jgi:prolipoprotein diacylglyceryltransferase
MAMSLYSATLATAIFIAYCLTAYRAKQKGLSTRIVWDSLPWVLVFGIVGARLYHVVNFWNYYSQNPVLIPQVWLGGLGIWGGIGGGFVGVVLYFCLGFERGPVQEVEIAGSGRCPDSLKESSPTITSGHPLNARCGTGRSLSRDVLKHLDAAAPAIALGQAIGRVGNILNKENLPYAYWEILLNLSIFLLILLLDQLREFGKVGGMFNRFRDFSMFQFYIIFYSLGRFGLEFFRTDSPWILGPLNVAQWVCLLIFSTVLILFMPRRKFGVS